MFWKINFDVINLHQKANLAKNLLEERDLDEKKQ